MKRALIGLAAAAAVALPALPASAEHPICVDHPRTPYEWFCVVLPDAG